jgi:xylan 1,4-beta-xylosidase
VIARGDGWCVTKQEEEIQILLYYYQHFSEQYASFTYFAASENDRYLPFAMDTRLSLTVHLTDLPYERYQLTERIINRSSGSSFDQWLDMGAMPVETTETVDYLRAVSIPRIKNRILKVQEGSLEISEELEPLELRLIELRP